MFKCVYNVYTVHYIKMFRVCKGDFKNKIRHFPNSLRKIIIHKSCSKPLKQSLNQFEAFLRKFLVCPFAISFPFSISSIVFKNLFRCFQNYLIRKLGNLSQKKDEPYWLVTIAIRQFVALGYLRH